MNMKKIWLVVATGILGMVFASSLVWSQPHAPLRDHGPRQVMSGR